MTKIVLIRPGATDYDRQGRVQGTLDIPLNEEGIAEVSRAIEGLRELNLDVVYSPLCQPALATAEAVTEALDIRLKKLERFHNLDHGLWQGMLIEEVRLKQPKVYRQWQENPRSVCPPEGEMLMAAEERIRPLIAKLLKRHRDDTIGLVVPEPLASLVRRALGAGELGDLWKAASEHGEWEVLDIEPETVGSNS